MRELASGPRKYSPNLDGFSCFIAILCDTSGADLLAARGCLARISPRSASMWPTRGEPIAPHRSAHSDRVCQALPVITARRANYPDQRSLKPGTTRPLVMKSPRLLVSRPTYAVGALYACPGPRRASYDTREGWNRGHAAIIPEPVVRRQRYRCRTSLGRQYLGILGLSSLSKQQLIFIHIQHRRSDCDWTAEICLHSPCDDRDRAGQCGAGMPDKSHQ